MSLFLAKPCQQFRLETIQTATDHFNKSKIIGKGGFGSVYKGVVVDGSTTTVVAVKRLNPDSKQGVGEFETEVKLLSKCRHCHVVNLLGYCNEHKELILVYEYMSNGTLADHLYKNHDSLLTWEQRVKICIGAARGLDYLHSGTGLSNRVIHLDVKSANILLDENWDAKIADLGLSKIGPANQSHSQVTADHVRGTHGYIDPQYLKNHKFSRKADVYAFGVVLLEVLSGTSALSGKIIPDQGLKDLAKWIQQHITNRTLNQIMDRRVLSQIEPECLKLFANTTSKSLHTDPKKRPSMSEVVAQLESVFACQKQTNPSSSLADDSILQLFNGGNNRSDVKGRSENISSDNESFSKHHVVSTDSRAHTSTDSKAHSKDPRIWSGQGIPKHKTDYLDMVGTTAMVGTAAMTGFMLIKEKDPTPENKTQVAKSVIKEGGKQENEDIDSEEKNENVGGEEYNEDVGGGVKNNDVHGGEKNEGVGGGENNEYIGGGEKNEDVGGGENNEYVGSGEKNEDVGSGENNEYVGSEEKNEDVGGEENNEDVCWASFY